MNVQTDLNVLTVSLQGAPGVVQWPKNLAHGKSGARPVAGQ